MLKMLMLTAVSCGITVGGIATICADINEDWLKQLVNGEASTAPPDLLDAAFAKYKMVRIEWLKQVRERIVVGRGLHYVFMHLRYTWAAKMCKKLTALALGCHNPDQDIGADDINVIKQLAFMMHTLAGGKNRLKFIKTVIAKLKEDAAEDDVSKLPDHTSELLANLAKIDLPDFLDLTDDTDDDDDEEEEEEEEDECGDENEPAEPSPAPVAKKTSRARATKKAPAAAAAKAKAKAKAATAADEDGSGRSSRRALRGNR